jgi:hypothetical protein
LAAPSGRSADHSSSQSSGRAWALSRISSTITDAMLMTLRHDRAAPRVELFGHGPDLLEEFGGPGDELVDLRDEHGAY